MLAERCRHCGIHVSIEVLVWAALFHDALFGKDPREFGCSTPEELSAKVAAEEMRKLGYLEHMIAAVIDAIKPTNAGVMPVTVEAKILRAADLSRMAGAYSDFREDFDKLAAEFGFEGGWDFFWPNLHGMVAYLWPEIRLTPQYWGTNHASEWHTNVARNIIRNYGVLCAERGEEPKVLIEIGPGRLPISLFRKHTPLELIIGVEPSQADRKVAAVLSVETAKLRNSAPEIILPGTADALPIPDDAGDIVMANVALRCPDALSPQELLRVLSLSDGRLEVIESYTPTYGADSIEVASRQIEAMLPGFSLIAEDHDFDFSGYPCVDPEAFRLIFGRTN